MRTSVVLPVLLAGSLQLWAGDCECAIPIKPKECVPVCRGALLMKLSKVDLTDKLKLNATTATEVLETRENGARSITDLEKLLPKKDQSEIQTKFAKLDAETASALFNKYDVKSVAAPIARPEELAKKKTKK